MSEFFQCSASVSSLLVGFDFAIAIATVAAAAGQFQSFFSEPTFAASFISSLVFFCKSCVSHSIEALEFLEFCPVLLLFYLPTPCPLAGSKSFLDLVVSLCLLFSPRFFLSLFHSIKHVWRLGGELRL